MTESKGRIMRKQNLLDETDLQEELGDIFRRVSSRIPADKINWVQSHFYPPIMKIIGQASGTGGEKTSFMYDIPENIVSVFQSGAQPEIHLINHPEIDLLGKEIARRAKLFDWSALLINFRTRSDMLCSVMIYAEGNDRYKEEHVRLLKPLTPRLQRVMEVLIADNEKQSQHPGQKEPVKDKNEFFRDADFVFHYPQ